MMSTRKFTLQTLTPTSEAKSNIRLFAIGIVFVSFIATFWILLDNQRNLQFHQLIESEAKNSLALVSSDFRDRVASLRRFKDRWVIRGGTPKTEFLADANSYIDDSAGLQALGWVDTISHVRWIAPLKGNEKAINFNLALEKRRKTALDTARNKRVLTMTAPIDLVQGGKGFNIYIPIYIGDTFEGFIGAVFRASPWFKSVLGHETNKNDFSTVVKIGGEVVYAANQLSTADNTRWISSNKSTVFGHEIEVVISPTMNFFSKNRSWLPEWATAISFLLMTLIIFIYYQYRHSVRATQIALSANSALDIERQKLQVGIEAIQESFAYFDAEDRLLHFNKKFAERHAHLGDDLKPGIHWDDMIRLKFAEGKNSELIESADKLIKKRRSLAIGSGETIVQKEDDGTWYLMSRQATPEGGTVATGLDITELKKGEEALHKAKQDAEKANQSKTKFLSSMSHELMTPLNAVIGFTQMLESSARELDPKYLGECVRHIANGGSLLHELIKNILTYSEIVDATVHINPEDVDATILAETCLDTVRTRADEKKIKLKLNILNQDLPLIHIDPMHLCEILTTFLKNSILYNHNGGDVTLGVSQLNENWLRFSVTDTGKGIAQEDQPEVFTAFRRFGMENTATSGTGVGLAIANALSERMGGQIGFESEKKREAYFGLSFL